MTEPLYNRMTSKDRRHQILEAGLTLAKQDGLINVKRREIAEFIEVSGPTITHHFGDTETLRNEIVTLAIERGDLVVVGEAVALKYAAVSNLTDEQRLDALALYAKK